MSTNSKREEKKEKKNEKISPVLIFICLLLIL